MSKAVKMTLPLTGLDSLYASSTGRGKNCTIPKEFLAALLMDHTMLLASAMRAGVQISEPDFFNHPKVKQHA